jgi:NitT/TauT family transport system substrate-binding protein
MNRRRLLGMFAATAAAGSALPLAAQTPTAIRVGAFASESTGGIFYAQDQGFLARHGLSATLNLTTGGAAVAAAMVAGDLDIGEADIVTLAIAHDRGIPFVFVAPGELHSNKVPTLACVVGDPALRSGNDFNGKTMACNVSRGFGSLITNVWIDNNGGDSKTVKWVEIPFPAVSAALQRGTIDGFCGPEPFVSAGVAAGGHLVLLDKNPVAPVILQGGWFATRDWVIKNPAAAGDLAGAIRDANEWANGNTSGSAEILSKYSKVPLAIIEGMKMRGQYQLRFDLSTMQPLIDAAAKYGYIANRFPAGDLIAKV